MARLTMTEADGACHCGAVRFHVRLAAGLDTARRCTCSFCRMRGAIAVSAPLDGFRIVEGEENLTEYRFNTGVAAHYFCKRCGIYTHHRRRSSPNEYGVNAACLDGVSPFDFEEVIVNDGALHPADDPQRRGSRIAGVLRFETARNDEDG